MEFSVPETFRIIELYQDVLWNQGSPEYFKAEKRKGALAGIKENKSNIMIHNDTAIFSFFILSYLSRGAGVGEITHDL